MEVQEKEKRLGIIIRSIDYILKERDEELGEDFIQELIEDAREKARELLIEEENNSPLVSCINVAVDDIGVFEVVFKEPISRVEEFIQAREEIVEFNDYVVDGLDRFFVVDIRKLEDYKMRRVMHNGRLIAYVWYDDSRYSKERISGDVRREVVDSFVSGEFNRVIEDGVYVSYNVEAYIDMGGDK